MITTACRFDPYDEAERLGIEVGFDDGRLAPDENGVWLARTRTIVLRPDLTVAMERSTLAHELGHAHFDHRLSSPTAELAADLYAAERLIRLDELVDEMRCSPDIGRWALELGVSGHLVKLFARVHRPEIRAAFRHSDLARLAS